MNSRVALLTGSALGILTVLAADFTLKSSVSGIDFDWSSGTNYVGEPEVGPRSGDRIIVPSGVTALVNQAAAALKGTCGLCDIVVQAGGVFTIYDDGLAKPRCTTYVRTLTGEGTVTSPNSVADDISICNSCTFDGIFAGVVNIRIRNDVRFELTRADHTGTGAPINEGTSTFAVHRFLPASGSGGTPGYKSFNLSESTTLEYVGEENLSETVETSLWSMRKFIVDVGAYGGLQLCPLVGDNAWQRLFVLTGSNSTEAVLRPKLGHDNYADGTVAIAKEGSGIWRLEKADTAARAITGVIAVRDGTLRFDDMAPTGSESSLGKGSQLYRPEYLSSLQSSDAIPYAVLFDGSDGKTGFLEPQHAGGTVVTNYDRQIGIETSGGIRSGLGRMYLNGITAASAGSKLLVLDGEVDNNDAVSGVSDGTGKMSIEKRGSGTWTVKPPFAFTGELAVKAGRLDLYNGGDRFNWFRLRIKENAYVSETYGAEAAACYSQAKGSAPSESEKRSQQLHRWVLLDENGTVHNCFSTTLDPNKTAVYSQQPTNDAVCCREMEMGLEAGAPESLINNVRPLTALCGKDNNWFNRAAPSLMNVNDESTWVSLVVRLADDVPEIKYCDFLSSLAFPSDFGGRVSTALRVDASCDGLNWVTVFDRNDLVPPSGAQKWYSGATTGGRTTLSFSDAASRFALSPTKPTPQPPLTVAATVSVAPGAELRCRGAVVFSKIELLAGGMGTIKGDASIAVTGTLVVPDIGEGVFSKTFATSLKDITGAANLANWQVSCESAPGRYVMRYNPATGDVQVMRRGTAILLR